MSLYLFMLARLSSGTGGNAPPAGAATAIVAVVVTSYLLWGQGLSPSVAVVCVCLLSVVVLELTWIVVARILAPLPCKVSPALCL